MLEQSVILNGPKLDIKVRKKGAEMRSVVFSGSNGIVIITLNRKEDSESFGMYVPPRVRKTIFFSGILHVRGSTVCQNGQIASAAFSV